jgi:hypothetical protein
MTSSSAHALKYTPSKVSRRKSAPIAKSAAALGNQRVAVRRESTALQGRRAALREAFEIIDKDIVAAFDGAYRRAVADPRSIERADGLYSKLSMARALERTLVEPFDAPSRVPEISISDLEKKQAKYAEWLPAFDDVKDFYIAKYWERLSASARARPAAVAKWLERSLRQYVRDADLIP